MIRRLLAALLRPVEPFLWMLPPSRLKNRALTLIGHDIAATARIGPVLVLGCERIVVGERSTIGPFNVFRSMRLVRIGIDCIFGQLNYVSAAPSFRALHPDAGGLIIGDLTIVTNRHYFDCSGEVVLKARSIVGGVRTILQTHEADLGRCTQTAGRITLHEGAMTATGCILMRGAELPSNSMLAAGSLLRGATKNGAPAEHLYVGRPAEAVRPLPPMKYWTRTDNEMPPDRVDL
ncbi:Carbonic anhydrase or acetyltransferase, isoleucine patch superfamily [Williamsia serinedens]|uniref:Carbonic anhydrase or acetyltransferase, isoleucine patch superfamily n=2 Tax=Williamsia serinedens TaxID=391736 RepID=A0ABT1H7P4_9NOCA|nr:Carbonic anhydrase or acetyltransferase, isoleucine patch superfamily [Williamsia serinedens]